MQLCGANRLMGIPDGDLDGHAHVFEAGLPLAAVRRYAPSHDALLSDYVGLLDQHGLAGGLLVQPSFLGSDNTYLLAALHACRHESRNKSMRGVVTLEPDTAPEMLDRMSHAGVVGMRFNLYGKGAGFQFDIEPWRRLLREVSQRGWHIDLHCEGHVLTEVLPLLLSAAETVVVDHFGLPDPLDPLHCAGQKAILRAPAGRVFVKASGPYRVFRDDRSDSAAERCVEVFQRLYETLGPDQMLWGSDWPWTQFDGRHSYADCLAWLTRWSMGRASRPEFSPPKMAHVVRDGIRRMDRR